MDAATFHALGLGVRADAVSTDNPNNAFDPAVAENSERSLGIQQAAVQMENSLYQLPPSAMRPDSPDLVPRGQITPFLRWAESKSFPLTERDWWMYVPSASSAAAATKQSPATASLCVFMDGHQYLPRVESALVVSFDSFYCPI